jgi:hypothetical protein
MKNSKGNEQPWSRAKIIVLFPLLILAWMIGWVLYWIGSQRMLQRTAQKETVQIPKEGTFERETLKEDSQQQIVA